MDYDEDRSQIRTGTGPEAMATLRNASIACSASPAPRTSPPPYATTKPTPTRSSHCSDQLKHDNDGTMIKPI